MGIKRIALATASPLSWRRCSLIAHYLMTGSLTYSPPRCPYVVRAGRTSWCGLATAPLTPPGATLPPTTPDTVTPGKKAPILVFETSLKGVYGNRVDVARPSFVLMVLIVLLMSTRLPYCWMSLPSPLPGFHTSPSPWFRYLDHSAFPSSWDATTTDARSCYSRYTEVPLLLSKSRWRGRMGIERIASAAITHSLWLMIVIFVYRSLCPLP